METVQNDVLDRFKETCLCSSPVDAGTEEECDEGMTMQQEHKVLNRAVSRMSNMAYAYAHKARRAERYLRIS